MLFGIIEENSIGKMETWDGCLVGEKKKKIIKLVGLIVLFLTYFSSSLYLSPRFFISLRPNIYTS